MSPSRLGLIIAGAFKRTAPDPIVLAIGLTALTAVLALVLGFPDGPTGVKRVNALLDAWRADSGIWHFLAFSMQMCVILITGHALACTRPVRAFIRSLAAWPASTASAAALVGVVAATAGVINWGLGLIVGALFAREVGRALQRRGITAHYPLLCAAGYMGLLVWHGGLSGSAPLSMTTMTGAAKVLPAEWVQDRKTANIEAELLEDAGIGLGETLWSPLNLFVTGGLVVAVPFVLMLLAPKDERDLEPIDRFDVADDDSAGETTPKGSTLPDRLGDSPIVAWLLVLPLCAAVGRYVFVRGIGAIDLNTINATMLALGLILHGSPVGYMKAAAEGARGCAGIMIQFPLYAGIMAMMKSSGLVDSFAAWMVEAGNEHTIPLLAFLSAGVVNMFVPSGGGQWGIQGPIALEAGLQAGIAPGKMIMAVAYGDQLTNMLQPFWALPLLAITGVRARDIVGYTAVVMVVAGLWIALGLLLFCETVMLARLHVTPPLATLTLDDPARRNALSAPMFDAIESALEDIERDDTVSVLLLHGTGGAFSAGFDLTAVLAEPPLLESFILRLSAICRRLRRLRAVVIAAVDGAAIAGGCAMLSACDLAVAAPDAKIGYPVHRLGISPAVSAPTLMQCIGPGPARALQLGGRLITGVEAHRRGLVSHVAGSRDTTLDEARALAESICAHGPDALAATKAWINELDGSLDDARFDPVATDTAAEAVRDDSIALLAAAWKK